MANANEDQFRHLSNYFCLCFIPFYYWCFNNSLLAWIPNYSWVQVKKLLLDASIGIICFWSLCNQSYSWQSFISMAVDHHYLLWVQGLLLLSAYPAADRLCLLVGRDLSHCLV